MEGDEKKLATLSQIIAKHCGDIAKDKLALRIHATSILLHDRNHEQVVGRFSENDRLDKLNYHLVKSHQLLSVLSENSIQQIALRLHRAVENVTAPLKGYNEKKDEHTTEFAKVVVKTTFTTEQGTRTISKTEEVRLSDIVQDRKTGEVSNGQDQLLKEEILAIASLSKALKEHRKSFIASAPSPGNLNTRAVAVTAACCNIWRQVNGKENTPVEINAGRLPPLGKFIDDVYQFIGLNCENPASAFRAIKKLGGLSAINLSIETPKN